MPAVGPQLDARRENNLNAALGRFQLLVVILELGLDSGRYVVETLSRLDGTSQRHVGDGASARRTGHDRLRVGALLELVPRRRRFLIERRRTKMRMEALGLFRTSTAEATHARSLPVEKGLDRPGF